MNTLDLVAAELQAADDARPRSLQVEPGASQAGSCRAALLMRTTGTEPTDRRLNLATLWGTAVHSMCEQAASPGDITEQKFFYRGIPCTIDRYRPDVQTVVDYKTKASPEKITEIRESGPSAGNVWQIMLGAAALIDAGHDVKTVELLYLPRSGGTVDDCYLWSADFDQAIADEAADWMRAERERAEALGRPATVDDLDGLRDEPFFFCAAVCEFFTLCRGPGALPSDDDYAEAARRFYEANRAAKAAADVKRAAAADLGGFAGNAGGLTVRQVPGSTSYALDVDAVREKRDLWQLVTGEDLPVKERVRAGYVTVARAKP